MCRFSFIIAVSVVTFVVGSTTASAATIFADDFEASPNGVSTAVYKDVSGDYDPVASIGTWSVFEGTNVALDPNGRPNEVQVTSSVTSPDPGAAGGNNFLRLAKLAGITSYVEANFTTTTSDDVTVSLSFTGDTGRIYLLDSAGKRVTFLRFNETGPGVVFEHNDKNHPDTYNTSAWNTLVIETHFATKTFDVTLNGVKETGYVFFDATATDFASMELYAAVDNDRRLYLDNVLVTQVPEPATIGLMALAGMVMCSRRKAS